MQKEIQKKQPAANPTSAAYGYYNMATPAKEAAAPQSPGGDHQAASGPAAPASWAPGFAGGAWDSWRGRGQHEGAAWASRRRAVQHDGARDGGCWCGGVQREGAASV